MAFRTVKYSMLRSNCNIVRFIQSYEVIVLAVVIATLIGSIIKFRLDILVNCRYCQIPQRGRFMISICYLKGL